MGKKVERIWVSNLIIWFWGIRRRKPRKSEEHEWTEYRVVKKKAKKTGGGKEETVKLGEGRGRHAP